MRRRARSHSPARALAIAALVAGVIAAAWALRGPPAPRSPVSSTSIFPTAPRASAATPAFCGPPRLLHAELDAAWPEGDLVVACVKGEVDGGAREARVCVSVDSSGHYRDEPVRTPPVPAPLVSAGFRRASADGRLSFEITGGGRAPHGAVGTLREARSGRVLKRAPINYDEHLRLAGWVGQGIVLETWLDEGPGCQRWLFDPGKAWPDLRRGGGVSLGRCDDGDVIAEALPGMLAIIEAGGAQVTFVDEDVLSASSLATECASGDADERGRVIAWLEGDGRLVLVYGAPVTGAVVRVDARRRTVIERWYPPECTGW